MPQNKVSFEKYKQETLELDNKKKVFLTIGLSLIGVAIILLIFGIVTLVAAFDGQLHFTAADILLILGVNALIAGFVMLIVRKAVFDKKLKEREKHINKAIQERKENKVYHN